MLFNWLFNISGNLSTLCIQVVMIKQYLMSCQPRETVRSCFVYKFIRDKGSIDHLCINPIHRIRLIRINT